MELEEKLHEIFCNVCEGIDADAKNLLSGKLLDSVTLLSLVTEIMSEFGVEIPFEVIVPENFDSLEAIAKTVRSYM